MSIIHVVSVSGGKDSAATACLALATQPRESLRFIFCDTGNEHELTYEYLELLDLFRVADEPAACSSAYGLCE